MCGYRALVAVERERDDRVRLETPMDEDAQAKAHRRLIELLNELRVALPGVQMLFGFMLVLPFSSGFSQTTHLERIVYFGAFLSATLATAFFIAPSVYHRIVFGRHQIPQLISVANRLAIAGTVFLAIALVASVFVITAVLFQTLLATLAATVTAVCFASLWYVLPLTRRVDRPLEETP